MCGWRRLTSFTAVFFLIYRQFGSIGLEALGDNQAAQSLLPGIDSRLESRLTHCDIDDT
jgi:hypothetical protein